MEGPNESSSLPVVDEERRSTDTIGRRNALGAHRRVQSTALLSSMFLDSTAALRHRTRSMSLNQPPSLLKFYPGSHLIESDEYLEQDSRYLSLWLLPPPDQLPKLSEEITRLSFKYSHSGKSSAPFTPHVTIIGSIKCDNRRHARELGDSLRSGLQGTGAVPCRFSSSAHCCAMYDDSGKLVWSQSCIAIMERSDEYMELLAKAREILNLPPGEWMFPAPACEPHYSKFYGHRDILSGATNSDDDKKNSAAIVPAPSDFIAQEAALYYTTPGTVEGVARWKEITRIPLLPSSRNGAALDEHNIPHPILR